MDTVLKDSTRILGWRPDVEGGAASDAPVSMGELLGNKGVLIGCALFSLQQFSGINAIVYFSSSVFAQVRAPVAEESPRPRRRAYEGL